MCLVARARARTKTQAVTDSSWTNAKNAKRGPVIVVEGKHSPEMWLLPPPRHDAPRHARAPDAKARGRFDSSSAPRRKGPGMPTEN